MDAVTVGILVLSDRASAGTYTDRSGPAVEAYLDERLANSIHWIVHVIPDEYATIHERLKHMADEEGCSLIITTGGTGPALRDVTPEATEAVCDKMLPGFGEAMRRESLKYVPTAILSRQTAGIRGNAFIINLPGKPKAVRECLDAVFPAIPDCVDLIGGPRLEFAADSETAFRPHEDQPDAD